LGTPTGLPSSEELGQLLAEIEVGLFLRRPQLPEEVLAAGWYLHGVASADAASELYPLDRRRAAWQVSAHVFDLALESEHETLHERLRYGFAAQVGYLKGGLPPNAMSIHRRLEPLIAPPDIRQSIDVAGLVLGATFLRLDWQKLRATLEHVESQFDELIRRGGVDDLSDTPYGPLTGVAQGCRLLMRYLIRGDRQALAAADEALRRAVDADVGGEQYLDVRWVAAHLRTLAAEFSAASVWEVLPPAVSRAVKRTFTVGQPGVSMLWPPQIELVSAQDGVSALEPSVQRIVLSVPTSSGKTLISQLFTLCHLSSGEGGVCYVVPTRSLAREVRRDLSRRLRLYSRSVAPEQSEWADLTQSAGSEHVEVLTPERLAHLIRTDVDGLLKRFGLFIFDEAHSVGEGDRGFTVETCIALLHWLTRETNHRIMLMSAALGNKGEIRSWVDPEHLGRSAASDWRGPRRLHAIYNTHIDWNQTPRRESVKSKSWPSRDVHEVRGRVRLRPTRTGTVVDLATTKPIGNFVVRVDAQGQRETDPVTGHLVKHSSSTPNYKMLPGLVQLVGEAGPVLIIRSTRRQTQELAKALAEDLGVNSATVGLAELSAGRLGPDHPLTGVLRCGVAYHHAGLPTDVLDAIEDAVRDGRLRYVVATTSLTDGVNLPVRTVIIIEPTGGEWAQPLTPAQVINAVGRAGRACLESEGWAILVRQAAPNPQDFARLSPSVADLEVRSALVDEEALAALAEFEDLQRISHDAVFITAGNRVSDFISFVWLVLSAGEELQRVGRSVELSAALPSTLAWQQLDDDTKERWRRLASAVATVYEAADPVRRKRWGRIATSVGSARQLDSVTDELAAAARQSTNDLSNPWHCLTLLDEQDVIAKLLALPEARGLRNPFSARGGAGRREIAIDHVGLLRRWMSGAEINEMADEFLADVAAPDFRYEQLGDYLTERFEHHLAWLVSALIDWTNERLESQGLVEHTLCPDLGGFIRYGTSDSLGLALLQQGVRSRRLANAVASNARDRGETTFEEMQTGLRSLGPARWAELFQTSLTDLRDLLDVARDREVLLLGRLLEGETVKILVTVFDSGFSGAVSINRHNQETLFGSLRLTAAGQDVGEVPTRHQAELSAMLDIGLPYLATIEQWPSGAELAIALSDS